ncbi:MAG: hypothetical protein C0501_07770 [Isosphaera sp.]|nr:hypothetical protein [Isosphaera sp.]
MPELTLEALAARVEALEQKVAELTRPAPPAARRGPVDWDAVQKALLELEDYDFDAWREQREYDLKHANDHRP